MRRQTIAASAALFCALAVPAAAQEQSAAPAARAAGFTDAERSALVRQITADARVHAIVGDRPRVIVGEPAYDKLQLERYSRTENAAPPAREIPVILFNAQTNRAAHALATADGRILRVEAISPTLVPYTPEDASLALDLARRSAGARIPNADRFVADTGTEATERAEYLAQILPLRTTATSDPCSRDRCVDVIFRKPSGYLRFRAHVDLTRRTVQMTGRQR